MSALRLGRLPDGTRHIVEDPTFTVGRVSFSRVGMRASGEYIVAQQARKEPNRSPDKRVGAHKRGEKLAPERLVCGKVLRIIGEPCARRAGHGYDCKSRADMDRRAEGRRSERPVGRPGDPSSYERHLEAKREYNRRRRAREREQRSGAA